MIPRFVVAALALAALLPAQTPPEKPAGKEAPAKEAPAKEPTAREIARQAAKEIKAIAKDGSVDEIQAALRLYAQVDDTDVVRAIGRLLDDEREDVRWAAVRALRYNPDPKAGSELIAAAKKKEIQASEVLFAEVLRGIGQHGDVRALDLLAEGFGPRKETRAITEARIDAVGRLRSPEAVDTLIKYARSGFAKGYEERICTALKGLTGEDQGSETKPWVLWWNRAKLGYRFPETPANPPAEWTRIWQTPEADALFDRPSPDLYGERPEGGGGRRGGGGRGGGS